jgi:hypothetical protein
LFLLFILFQKKESLRSDSLFSLGPAEHADRVGLTYRECRRLRAILAARAQGVPLENESLPALGLLSTTEIEDTLRVYWVEFERRYVVDVMGEINAGLAWFTEWRRDLFTHEGGQRYDKRATRIAQGKFVGHPPFGIVKVGHEQDETFHYQIAAASSEWLLQAFEEAACGRSFG